MSNIHVVVDIDGVLANVDSYINALNQKTGKRWSREDMAWYGALWDLYGKEVAREVFADEGVAISIKPRLDNINEVYMWSMLSRNCTIDIVTSRPAGVREATEQWLKRVGLSGFPFSQDYKPAKGNRISCRTAPVIVAATSALCLQYGYSGTPTSRRCRI
jgi:heat shock protein HspQ